MTTKWIQRRKHILLIQICLISSLSWLSLLSLSNKGFIFFEVNNLDENTNNNNNLFQQNSVKVNHIYNVGSTETFSIVDQSDTWITRTGTCKQVSEEAYFFLDNSDPNIIDWIGYGDLVDNIMMPILRTNFGNPTDIDGNNRVVLFFTSRIGPGVGGYSYTWVDLYGNQSPYQGSPIPYWGEIVYMNSDSSSGSQKSTMIHELQHLIMGGLDMNEVSWFNEGCSRLSEILYSKAIGYNITYTVQTPHGTSLIYWNTENTNYEYSIALSFVTYLYDQFGGLNLSAIYNANSDGEKLQSITAVMTIINQFYPSLSFKRLILNWLIASTVDLKYSGNIREYYFENFDAGVTPLTFPIPIKKKTYPYDETLSLYPWENAIYKFKDFLDPNKVNITINIPSDSQNHDFGVNIIKEKIYENLTDYEINSFLLTGDNISEGYHTSFNASFENVTIFYVTISHLDGGEGNYYYDIPTSEKNVQYTLKVSAGELNQSTTQSDQTNQTNTMTRNLVSADIPIILLLIFGLGFKIISKHYSLINKRR